MGIQKILSPLLIISYVCGSRVIEFPAGFPKQWFGLLYMLLLWSLYFAFIYEVMPYTIDYPVLYQIYFYLNIFIMLLSIIFGLYYNKTFKNCIKTLVIVDNTLKELGTITDYKLRMRTIWLILGWFIIATLTIYGEILLLSKQNHDMNIVQAIYISFIHIYCININVINDLTITSILSYVGLKFDQINEHLEKLITQNNKRTMKQISERPVLLFHQFKYAKASRNVYMIWILMHLHLELRKMFRKIDLIFGAQMTIKMMCFFAFILLCCISALKFVDHYVTNIIYYIFYIIECNTIIFYIILVWVFLHVFGLFLTNHECERVSLKANATGDFINKLLYSNRDVELHENILQFLFMTQSPSRFYRLKPFQFGFKFLKQFSISAAIDIATDYFTVSEN